MAGYHFLACIESLSFYSAVFFILGIFLKGKTDINNVVFYIACLYPILLTIHQILIARGLKELSHKEKYYFFPQLFKAIGLALIKPFEETYIFLLVATRKHKIQDIDKKHDALDFAQALFGFIISIIIVLIGVFYFK